MRRILHALVAATLVPLSACDPADTDTARTTQMKDGQNIQGCFGDDADAAKPHCFASTSRGDFAPQGGAWKDNCRAVSLWNNTESMPLPTRKNPHAKADMTGRLCLRDGSGYTFTFDR